MAVVFFARGRWRRRRALLQFLRSRSCKLAQRVNGQSTRCLRVHGVGRLISIGNGAREQQCRRSGAVRRAKRSQRRKNGVARVERERSTEP